MGFEFFWKVDELHHEDANQASDREGKVGAQESGLKEILSPRGEVRSNNRTENSAR